MAQSTIQDFVGRRLLDVAFPGELQQQREAVALFFDRLEALSDDPQGLEPQLKDLRVEPRLAERGVAIFFRDPTFSLIGWRVFAQLLSSDLFGALSSVRFLVRAIEPIPRNGGAPASADIFDERRWTMLKADLSALADQARAG